MNQFPPHRPDVRSILRRSVAACALIAAGASIATGCGGDVGDGAPDGGALAWLPVDTPIVAVADISAKRLDTAFETVERVPAWALFQQSVPASDGAGARTALLERLFEAGGLDSGKATAEQLDEAFGAITGAAVLTADADDKGKGDRNADGELVAWIDVRDEEAALDAVSAMTPGDDSSTDHAGTTVHDGGCEDGCAYLVRDDLLFLAATQAVLEELVNTRDDGDAPWLSGEHARTLHDDLVDGALVGVVAQTDPMLKDAAADPHVPDWVAAAASFEEPGLRIRGLWSDPSDIAAPPVAARELVERLPEDVSMASAGVRTGTDEAPSDSLHALVHYALDGDDATGAKHTIEYVTTDSRPREDVVPEQAAKALADAGIEGPFGGARDAIAFKVTPSSRAGKALKQATSTPLLQALAAGLGVDIDRLLSAQGMGFEPTRADALMVYGNGAGAASRAASSLAADGESSLRQLDAYRQVLDAADVPDQTGAFGWVNLKQVGEGGLDELSRSNPRVSLVAPSILKSFDTLPGVLWWTARAELSGERYGTFDLVVPVFEKPSAEE